MSVDNFGYISSLLLILPFLQPIDTFDFIYMTTHAVEIITTRSAVTNNRYLKNKLLVESRPELLQGNKREIALIIIFTYKKIDNENL